MQSRTAFLALAALAIVACSDGTTTPTSRTMAPASASKDAAPTQNLYTSGSDVDTWDAIAETNQPSDYATAYCTATPKVGLTANWQNPHKASVTSHDWQYDYFSAPWISAWPGNPKPESSVGNPVAPNYNWTKYQTQVSGNGTFVLQLLADNCSWIYLDGTLVGVQNDDHSHLSYGLTLNGTHTLTFIIFDGGGLAGGKFRLETTSSPPPPLDTDGDGHANQQDAFPLDPNEWADTDGDGVGDNADVEPTLNNNYYYVTWSSANPTGGTASGTITLANGHTVGVQFHAVHSNGGAAPFFGSVYDAGSGLQKNGGVDGAFNHWIVPANNTTYTSKYVFNRPTNGTMIALSGGTTDSYVITFSEPVQDPVMDIVSLGAGSDASEYDFGREFELLSQGPGAWGGGNSSLSVLPGQRLQGHEGNGAVRFVGSFSTFSWTVPDGEVYHNFTIGIRGLADANADHDGDGVPDAHDNCPTTANTNQADADFDGVGDACDAVNDSNVDTDGDGLTNSQEHTIGTNPTNPDTDGDGYADGVDAFPLDPSRHLSDTTPPVVTYTVSGTQGANGWYTSDVTVTWTVSDAESAVTSAACTPTTLTANSASATVSCGATSTGGTTKVTTDAIKLDKTVPSVSATVVSGTLNPSGWYTTPVTIAWTASAAGPSGQTLSSDCANTALTSNSAGVTFTCTVTTGAGISSPQGTKALKLDMTKPTVTGAVVSGTTGTNGWYITPVTVAWTVSQPGPSGQNKSADCTNTTLSTDNAAYTFTCTVTTVAGIASEQGTVGVKLDATVPAVTYSGNAGSYTVDQNVNIICSASDNLSGVGSTTCANISGPAYNFVDKHSFSATATDKAGNVGHGATSFNVVVAGDGICALTQQWVVEPGKGGGVANSLCVKLQHKDYGAYINEVSAQSGKKIAADKAAILISLARRL